MVKEFQTNYGGLSSQRGKLTKIQTLPGWPMLAGQPSRVDLWAFPIRGMPNGGRDVSPPRTKNIVSLQRSRGAHVAAQCEEMLEFAQFSSEHVDCRRLNDFRARPFQALPECVAAEDRVNC